MGVCRCRGLLPSPEVRSGDPGAPLGHAVGTEVARDYSWCLQQGVVTAPGFWEGGGEGLQPFLVSGTEVVGAEEH